MFCTPLKCFLLIFCTSGLCSVAEKNGSRLIVSSGQRISLKQAGAYACRPLEIYLFNQVALKLLIQIKKDVIKTNTKSIKIT